VKRDQPPNARARRTLRTAGRLACAALLTCGVLLLTGPSPASAHAVELRHGSDEGGVFSGHNGVWVHDAECDNHGVYVEYYLVNSATVFSLWDPDGCRGSDGVQYTNYAIDFFRLCENTQGCTVWTDA
jgi:hypothetical protein